MPEGMAIEQMTADLARLKGFHTTTRVPYLKTTSEQDSAADIDVMGINAAGEVLAAECKAYSAPDDYYNWNTSNRTAEIRDIVADYANQIDTVLDPEFADEFDEQITIDVIWVVVKGYFASESSYGRSVVKASKADFESELSDDFGVDVELLPTHDLILRLLSAVAEDMGTRRVRYSSSSLEFMRLLASIARNRPDTITEITKEFQQLSEG